MLKHLQSREDWNQKSLGAKGFTLIELLVVIVILGILAAVVIFAVGGVQDTADENACLTEVKTVKTAVEAYKADNDNTPPATAAALTPTYLESAPTYVTVTNGVLGETAKSGEAGNCDDAI